MDSLDLGPVENARVALKRAVLVHESLCSLTELDPVSKEYLNLSSQTHCPFVANHNIV